RVPPAAERPLAGLVGAGGGRTPAAGGLATAARPDAAGLPEALSARLPRSSPALRDLPAGAGRTADPAGNPGTWQPAPGSAPDGDLAGAAAGSPRLGPPAGDRRRRTR